VSPAKTDQPIEQHLPEIHDILPAALREAQRAGI